MPRWLRLNHHYFFIYISISTIFLSFYLSSHSLMASPLTLQHYIFYSLKTFRAEVGVKCNPNAPFSSQISVNVKEKYGLTKSVLFRGFLLRCSSASKKGSPRWITPEALSSMASDADSGEKIFLDEQSEPKRYCGEMVFTRVNCLVWVIHESARSFSLAIQALDFVRTGPELAMAWVGVDVHAWHKHIAYQVAAYAMLKAANEVELFLSYKRCNSPSPVQEILSLKINFLEERIENQLNTRNPKLVQWFKMVELPRITGLFIPLFKKWSLDYAGSGVAGIILAISCCAAIQKLGSGRISSSLIFSVSVEDAIRELMSSADGLVSIEKLYQLSTEAGFEEEFLWYFGGKVLPNENIENLEFWVGLVQKKLSAAFDRESVFSDKHRFHDKEVLGTLGLFAYLGRETRLFLLRMGIKDLDEQTKDFLGYLECGSLLIYPEFSNLSEYQLFMEVVSDEIGWLDFYAAFTCKFFQDRKKSKQHAIQAEKEIILYTAFTVCYDVISGFAHYSNSKQQSLSTNLLEFLLQSQNLLSTCLEDFWAAYGRAGVWQNHLHPNAAIEPAQPGNPNDEKVELMTESAERGGTSLPVHGTTHSSLVLEAQKKRIDLIKGGKHLCESKLHEAANSVSADSVNLGELGHSPVSKPLRESLLKRSTVKLVSASNAIWMGTQLLVIDISETLRILLKKIRGWKITKRERKKMETTLADIATLVPITILMLLPVSAIGHAAMLAAIKKYMPYLIPSPYSSERLNSVKQVKRMKKMEVQPQTNTENVSSRVV